VQGLVKECIGRESALGKFLRDQRAVLQGCCCCSPQCRDKARERFFQLFEVALEIHWRRIEPLPELIGKLNRHGFGAFQAGQMPRRLDAKVSQNGANIIRLRQRPPVDLVWRCVLEIIFETTPDPLIHLNDEL
jgi:hypothetical protein